MRWNPKCELDLIVSQDEDHPELGAIHLDVAKKLLVACDGHRIAAIPVYDLNGTETSGPINVEAFRRGAGKLTFVEGRAQKTPDGVVFPQPDIGLKQFPDWESAVKHGQQQFRVVVNPRYIAELARALGGADAIQMSVASPLEPVDIYAEGFEHGAMAVVMPRRSV